ncbi:transposase, partial [Escherichia coli]|nr:transposase [Escherichia coli]MDL6359313.1 transposase [Escherichia coli]
MMATYGGQFTLTILQADAFTGYDRLFSAEREGGALTEVACWAHARRKI